MWSSPSEWNDSVASEDVETYWGNGFWGPLAAGLAAGAYVVAPGAYHVDTQTLTLISFVDLAP